MVVEAETLAGRVYLITGGAGGIGSDLARKLVARDDSVIVFGRTPAKLDALVAELGPLALARQGDARDPESLRAAVQSGLEAFGRLDGLAHCVGSIVLKPLHLTTVEEFREAIEVNLTSAFLAIKAVLEPLRKANAGSIVLLSTVAASRGLNNHETISAAKSGVEGLVRSSAITYARQNIRINAVAPSLTETPLSAPLIRSDLARQFSLALHPLGRLGLPGDVASAVAFLLGDESDWITGQVLGVDGGLGAGVAPPRASGPSAS